MSGPVQQERLKWRYRWKVRDGGGLPLVVDQFVPYHCQDGGELAHRHCPKHTPLHEKPLRCPESQEAEPFPYPRLLSSFPLRGYTMRRQHTVFRALRISRMPVDNVKIPSCLMVISCSNSLNSSVASVFASLPNYNQLSRSLLQDLVPSRPSTASQPRVCRDVIPA